MDALFEAACRGLFHQVEMATICLPTHPNNRKADLFDLTGDQPNDKTDAFLGSSLALCTSPDTKNRTIMLL